MAPIRVLHVKQATYLAPSETFVHNRVLNPICGRPVPVIAHEVARAYLNHPEIRFFELCKLPAIRRRVEESINYRLRWYPFYHQVICRTRPQLIHAHFSGAGEACAWPARQFRIPLVVNFYGIETNYHIFNPVERRRLQRVYACADAIICSSAAMKEAIAASGCPEQKIAVVRCGVDTEFFSGDVLEWRAGQKLNLVSVARLHPEKGLGYLLKACHLLKTQHLANWGLRIIGVGPAESELKQQALELGIKDQVEFVGSGSPAEVLAELRRAHLMILPSLKESQGLALQEAQATCTPVIASNVGGVPEGVVDGESGLLVEPRSAQAIVNAIAWFLTDHGSFGRMGQRGRQFVEAQFSRRVEYRQLDQVYVSVLACRGKG